MGGKPGIDLQCVSGEVPKLKTPSDPLGGRRSDWLAGPDLLALKSNRTDWLIGLPFQTFIQTAAAAELAKQHPDFAAIRDPGEPDFSGINHFASQTVHYALFSQE